MTVPRVSPSVSSLYSASQLQLIKSGRVSNAEQQRHAGTTCNACGMSPIVGPRHKCAVCPSVDLCAGCVDTADHDRSHPLFKLRHPVQSAAGFNGALKTFVESVHEGDTFWGFRFTVTAKFSPQYIRTLLQSHSAELAAAVQSVRKYSGPGEGMAMDAQCVEIMNRALEKMGNGETKKSGGGGRNRRNRRDDDEEVQAVAADADYLAVAIEPRTLVTDTKELVIYSHLANCSLEDVWMRMVRSERTTPG